MQSAQVSEKVETDFSQSRQIKRFFNTSYALTEQNLSVTGKIEKKVTENIQLFCFSYNSVQKIHIDLLSTNIYLVEVFFFSHQM
jgi:hypothetical protein